MGMNNKGDIVPSKIIDKGNYKNAYYWGQISNGINFTIVGCRTGDSYHCGLFSFFIGGYANANNKDIGFVKVTILDT